MLRPDSHFLRQTLVDDQVLETTDPDVAVASASASQIPLTADWSAPRQPLRFSLREFVLPSMRAAVVRLRYGSRYTVQAGPTGSCYHLNLPLAGVTEVSHGRWSAGAVAGRTGVMLSPTRSTRFRSDGGFDEITLNVDCAVLDRHFRRLTDERVRDRIEFAPEIDLRRGGGGRLLALLPRLIEYVRTGDCPAEIAQAEEAVLDTILLLLDHDHREFVHRAASYPGRLLVRRAEEYIEAHADFPLRITEVARAHQVSTRTLQRAFRQHRGCTPLQFLKRSRLDLAMQHLRRAEPETTVTVAAMQSGFSHLGQFSVDFRRRFHVSPSVTLRQARV